MVIWITEDTLKGNQIHWRSFFTQISCCSATTRLIFVVVPHHIDFVISTLQRKWQQIKLWTLSVIWGRVDNIRVLTSCSFNIKQIVTIASINDCYIEPILIYKFEWNAWIFSNQSIHPVNFWIIHLHFLNCFPQEDILLQ